jgi:hypothetical protein
VVPTLLNNEKFGTLAEIKDHLKNSPTDAVGSNSHLIFQDLSIFIKFMSTLALIVILN